MELKVNTKQLTLIQLVYTILVVGWIDTFKYVSILPLLADLFNVFLLLLLKKRTDYTDQYCARFWNAVTLLIFFECLLSIIQLIDNGVIRGVALTFWSLRMFFRPFILLKCIECAFGKEEADVIDRMIMPINYLHLICSAVEFYVLGIRYDYNGGVFGASQGCNGQVNILYSALLIYIVLQYYAKRRTLKDVIVIVVSAIVVAYWSELKFLYVEIVVLVFLTFIITKPSWRSISLIIGGVVLLLISMPRIIEILPDNFSQMNTIEGLLEYNNSAYNESGLGFISRGNGIELVNTQINNDSMFISLLGNGLGSANSIAFLNINSIIEDMHGWRNYDYFSLTYMYIEMGWLGLIGFAILFLLLGLRYLRIEDMFYRLFGIGMIVIMFINMWYNSSWIIDSTAYLLVLFLALPLISNKIEIAEEEK